MSEVFDSVDQMSAEWLTQILKNRGVLMRGGVVEIEIERSYETGPSVVSHLLVHYSRDVLGELPGRLFLKIPKPHKILLGGNEVKFYLQAEGLPHTVTCYDAQYDAEAGSAHLLLADMSETHHSGGELSRDRALGAVDSLAAVHAHWWDHPDLGRYLGTSPEEGFCHKYSDRYEGNQRRFQQLVDLHGESIGSVVRALYETVLARGPDILLQRAGRGDLTLGHHDLHANNLLFPNDPQGQTFIIDWQNDWCWWGVKDLAFLLTFSWEPNDSRQLEREMLGRYCQRLEEAGVEDYAWEKAWHDYRLSTVELLFRPLGNRQAPDVLRNVERATQAFEALDCRELL